MVDRILVIGCPASGKSTLAARLAAALDLPLIGLDELFFGPGWSVPDPGEWQRRVDRCTAGPQWVIDGNHQSTFERRLAAADYVVLFDRPPARCVISYLRRAARLKVAALRGADPDRFPPHMRTASGIRVTSRPARFVWFILRFASVRRAMERSLAGFPGRIERISSFAEADRLVAELEGART